MKNLDGIEAIFAKAGAEERSGLSEPEVYRVLELAGLAAPKHALYPAGGFDAAAEIDGVKCFPSPSALPEKIDMYVVAVPSPEVPRVLAEAGDSGKVNGAALARVIEKARANGKQVVLYKAGRTAVGQKAVMGHTASIAGDYLVTRLIMENAGALVAETFDDFNDLAALACSFAGLEIKHGNTFFMSNAGFEAAGMADSIAGHVKAGLDAATAEEMTRTLKDFKLDSIVDAKNPLDITPMASDGAIGGIVKTALGSDEFSGAVVSMIPLTPVMNTLPKGGAWPDDLDKSFLKEAAQAARGAGKPLLFCVACGPKYEPYCAYAQGLGLPVFRSADRAVKLYAAYLDYILGRAA